MERLINTGVWGGDKNVYFIVISFAFAATLVLIPAADVPSANSVRNSSGVMQTVG